jgi:anaerobic magnesium-protoporphyrin IX monomethyl ester cyclase
MLEYGGDVATVTGITFRQGATIVMTPKRCIMASINELPAAWDLLDWQNSKISLSPKNHSNPNKEAFLNSHCYEFSGRDLF